MTMHWLFFVLVLVCCLPVDSTGEIPIATGEIPHLSGEIPDATAQKYENNIFAAVDHMDPLVDIEWRLMQIARKDLEKRRENLNQISEFIKRVGEAPVYTSNPLKNYHVIRFVGPTEALGRGLVLIKTVFTDFL